MNLSGTVNRFEPRPDSFDKVDVRPDLVNCTLGIRVCFVESGGAEWGTMCSDETDGTRLSNNDLSLELEKKERIEACLRSVED
jgi:hypothetical protein